MPNLGKNIKKLPSFTEIHHQVHVFMVFEGLVESHDVGVVSLFHDIDFSADSFLVLNSVLRDDFDCKFLSVDVAPSSACDAI